MIFCCETNSGSVVELGCVLFCRPKVENKRDNTEPEKSGFPVTGASTMKYVCLPLCLIILLNFDFCLRCNAFNY